MDENAIVLTAAVLISLAFNWVPRLKEWYTALDDNIQRLVMLGALAISAAAVFGASCTGFTIPGVSLSVSCDQAGVRSLVQLFINALVLNQVAFLALPKPRS